MDDDRSRESSAVSAKRNFLVFPEGTTSAGRAVLPLKFGVFHSLLPVTPIVLHYRCPHFHVSYEVVNSLEWLPLALASPSLASLHVYVLPPQSPSTDIAAGGLEDDCDRGSREDEDIRGTLSAITTTDDGDLHEQLPHAVAKAAAESKASSTSQAHNARRLHQFTEQVHSRMEAVLRWAEAADKNGASLPSHDAASGCNGDSSSGAPFSAADNFRVKLDIKRRIGSEAPLTTKDPHSSVTTMMLPANRTTLTSQEEEEGEETRFRASGVKRE
eukprot:GHVU01178415.1.p1 GENE.GHVU01178415.1~~GHVU01178415.1.p1  ORF type:complete len:272 (+),score=41.83 GHVU01178415.1:1-816(+)